jgi:putative flippase GtrA
MRLIKYFFVGGAAAIVDIGLFTLFASYLAWPWLPVSIATFILATAINYFLSIKFVFESGIKHTKSVEIIGVFGISALALLVNQAVLYMAIEWFDWNLVISKITATGTVFFWNYFGRSKLIFAQNSNQ